MDDLYRQVHEELVEQYMESHPGISWTTAYDVTADLAYDEYRNRLADMADFYRMRAKEGL